MLALSKRIEAFNRLGDFLSAELALAESSWINTLTNQAKIKNGWFEKREVLHALEYWSLTLDTENLSTWINSNNVSDSVSRLNIGLILAGNIPMVGFHDILSTMLVGHRAMIKMSTNDDVIIPELLEKLTEITPEMSDYYAVVDRLTDYQAVLATGSNNSARYFEQYFSHVPMVIRKNRTGVAILGGDESEDDLNGLMKDCFQYFGLGCRNVTKLYLPENYDLKKIFSASLPFAYLMDNKKYVNNYTYHKALMMMERISVLENELIMMREDPSLFSPVSVLNYEFYRNEEELSELIKSKLDSVQCVIGKKQTPFGQGQKPRLSDFSDGINTLEFMQNLEAVQLPN